MQADFTRKISKLSGAQRRIRTTDTRIFNPLLYQLSYLGIRTPLQETLRMSGQVGNRPWMARVISCKLALARSGRAFFERY